jgi:hypothetical protein
MKRAIIILLLVGGIAIGWLAKSVFAPDYPSHWDALKLGMTPDQAKAAVPDLDPWLRDIKGFDQASHHLGDRHWNLQVIYDKNGRVSEISKNYVDHQNGLFNRSIVELKP